jgi:uncharacterized protein
VFAILFGTALGLLIGNRLTEQMRSSVVTSLGLVTLVIGIQNAMRTGNIVLPLLGVTIGVIIGEALRLDRLLEHLAGWIQARFQGEGGDRQRFITGFITASLIFAIGPLAFVGAIQDGMGLNSGLQFLIIKSLLDLFASMAFAASFGIGVGFSALTILVVQGGLALLGMGLVSLLEAGTSAAAVAQLPAVIEMTAAGGLLLMALSLILLEIREPRVANFLPALVITPLLVLGAQALGISIYPL